LFYKLKYRLNHTDNASQVNLKQNLAQDDNDDECSDTDHGRKKNLKSLANYVFGKQKNFLINWFL